MKKILATCILLIYALGISGVGTDTHFCCGKFTHVNFISGIFSTSKNAANNKNGCCRNVNHIYKVHDAYQQSANFVYKAPPATAFSGKQGFEGQKGLLLFSADITSNMFLSPPFLRSSFPLYIYISVFRI